MDASNSSAHRGVIELDRLPGDGNIRRGHPAEQAAWIWTETDCPDRSSIVCWTNTFRVESPQVVRLHITADQRLAWWRKLPDLGFTALPEAPEPSRSDAHGWAAHPYFHTFASKFTASCVHPRGTVRVSYRREEDQAEFRIQAPPGVVGELVYNGARHPLSGPGGTWKICV